MTLLSIVLVLAVVGFASWLVMQIPMPAKIQQILIGVIIFFVVIWTLQQAGIIHTNLRLK